MSTFRSLIKAPRYTSTFSRFLSMSTFSTSSSPKITAAIPKGAWDTHIHIFDPEKWPYPPTRRYTPAAASIDQYPQDITGCNSLVIIHASMQGASPAALLDTLSKGPSKGYTLRGLATLDFDALTDDDLQHLHAAGVRGTRMHLMMEGAANSAADIEKRIRAIAPRIAPLGWAIDIFAPLESWAGMTDFILRDLDPRVKLVADHLGSAYPGDECKPEYQALLHLIREERLYIKLSAFERMYDGHPEGIASLAGVAKGIIEAGPSRIMYASDWPHTQLGRYRKGKSEWQKLNEVEPFRDVPNALHIESLRQWIKDEDTWERFWVDNPKAVFA